MPDSIHQTKSSASPIGKKCFITHDIRELYPEDELAAEMGLQAYFGAPLIDSAGKTTGLIVVADVKPMAIKPWMEVLLDVYARRIAIELERDAAVVELKTHRDHLEEEVKERTAALEASNKELESYSYSIAHDLRTPLRCVTSFSEIVLDDAGDRLTNDELDHLKRIVDAGKHMSDLIDDILELARISRRDLHKEDVDLSRLAQEIRTRLDRYQPKRSVKWNIKDDLKARGDRQLISVALENLLGNAFKYTGTKSPAHIDFGLLNDAGKRVFYVRDNGVGFDMKFDDKLFRPFERLHNNKEFKGTGIGLATVQRVVQRHGGRAWAKSEIDKGATFYFTLGEW